MTNSEDTGKILYIDHSPLLGRGVDRNWYVNEINAHASLICYLANLRPKIIDTVEVREREGEIIYGLRNGGKIKTSRNPFGGIEVTVTDCPEDIFNELSNVSKQGGKSSA